jgi:MFS family permease
MNFRDALALPGVRRLWIGQLVSIAGDFLAIFAVLTLVSFRLHASSAAITGVTIAYMLPLALFSPVSGALADRWNPKRIMIVSDLTRAALILLLLPARQLAEIYAILFALATVSTFFIPSQSMTVRTLVPRAQLLNVNTLMQQTNLTLRLASPAIAGALFARFGAASCFYLDSLSFICSACMLSTIAIRPVVRSSRPNPRDLFAGLRFIVTHPDISFVTAAMAAATFAISCASPLLAVFVRDILHSGVQTFAVVSSSIGLGLIAGTQSVRYCAKRLPTRSLVTLGLSIAACAIALIGTSGFAIVTATGAFLLGAGVGLLTVPAQTLIHSATPLEMAGRVTSGVMTAIAAAQIMGLVASATLAPVIGLRPLFFASATALALTAGARFRQSLPKQRRQTGLNLRRDEAGLIQIHQVSRVLCTEARQLHANQVFQRDEPKSANAAARTQLIAKE